MSEELPEADFLDPIEFTWTPERAKIRRMVREFAASIDSDKADSSDDQPDPSLLSTVQADTDPHGSACDPDDWEANR